MQAAALLEVEPVHQPVDQSVVRAVGKGRIRLRRQLLAGHQLDRDQAARGQQSGPGRGEPVMEHVVQGEHVARADVAPGHAQPVHLGLEQEQRFDPQPRGVDGTQAAEQVKQSILTNTTCITTNYLYGITMKIASLGPTVLERETIFCISLACTVFTSKAFFVSAQNLNRY